MHYVRIYVIVNPAVPRDRRHWQPPSMQIEAASNSTAPTSGASTHMTRLRQLPRAPPP